VRSRLATLAVAAVAVGLAAACTSSPPQPDRNDRPVRPQWRAVTLPAPPGPAGRLTPRAATFCGDRWYVVGGVATAAGETRPAVWSTTDPGAAQGWTALPIEATDYYAVRSIIYSVSCRDGLVAAIGARSGGAHGNPRTRVFYERPDHGFVGVTSTDFLLFAGEDAVSVDRVAAGPKGFLLAGNRVSGAAVWLSTDARAYEIVEGAPALASDTALQTNATDAVAVDAGWLVTGSGRGPDRIDRDPLAWTSPDGRAWTRVPLPATTADEVAQRLVRTAVGMLALGTSGDGFAAWRGDPSGASGWRTAGRFGATGSGVVAGIEAAAVLPDARRVLVATAAADGHRLWSGGLDGAGWRPVDLPVTVPIGGATAGSVAVRAGTALLLTDDGTIGSAWVAPFSGL
jgi:hypothetical protein